jgi:hypothetical protein
MTMKKMLAACALIAMSGAALAEDPKPFGQVDNWSLFKAGDVGACMATKYNGPSDTGDHLIISAHLDGKGRVVVVRESWQIPEGAYKITVQFDDGEKKEVDAFTTTKNSIATEFDWNQNVFSLLSSGRKLTVWVGNQVLGFSLDASARMLPDLFRCIGEVQSASNSNPFGSVPAAPVSAPSNPFRAL